MRGYGYDVVAVEGGGGRKERAERRRSERTRILALSQGPVPTFERDGSCARGWIEARHTHKSGQARRLKEPPPLSLSCLFHAFFPHAHLVDASSFIGSCARTKTTNWPSEHAVTRRCQNKMRYHIYRQHVIIMLHALLRIPVYYYRKSTTCKLPSHKPRHSRQVASSNASIWHASVEKGSGGSGGSNTPWNISTFPFAVLLSSIFMSRDRVVSRLCSIHTARHPVRPMPTSRIDVSAGKNARALDTAGPSPRRALSRLKHKNRPTGLLCVVASTTKTARQDVNRLGT